MAAKVGSTEWFGGVPPRLTFGGHDCGEANYDAYNKSTEDFAKPLADAMSKVNAILGFKP